MEKKYVCFTFLTFQGRRATKYMVPSTCKRYSTGALRRTVPSEEELLFIKLQGGQGERGFIVYKLGLCFELAGPSTCPPPLAAIMSSPLRYRSYESFGSSESQEPRESELCEMCERANRNRLNQSLMSHPQITEWMNCNR